MTIFEPLINGRSKVWRDGRGLHIKIPAPVNIFANCFLAVWLGAWTVGGFWAWQAFLFGPTAQPGSNDFGNRAFLGFWLCGWLLGEAFAGYQLLWSFFGSETIRLDATRLEHRWNLLGFGKTRLYDLTQVKRLRNESGPTPSWFARSPWPGMAAGGIAFDYGRGTVVVARGIDPGEATSIVEQINSFDLRRAPADRR